MNYQNILATNQNGISTITINRPKQLNALNKLTINELHHAITTAQSNDTVRVLILTGEGEKAFIAGADIKEFAGFSQQEGEKLSSEGHDKLFNLVENLSKPVISAINGFALGGGLELAMASHIRIAAESAKLGLPEVGLGVIPGYGGTQRLAQITGKGKAMELIMTANMINAQEALKIGLVNHVVPLSELKDFSIKMASRIMRNSPMALGNAIRAVNANYKDGVDGFKEEINAFGDCFGTKEFIEGTSAFLEKRKPNF
jgi:enoyl-CoA hydratase